jgi:tellurite methyltransferase
MIQVFLVVLFFLNSSWGRNPISGSRFEHLSGVKVSQDSKTQWDERYARPTFVYGKSPAEFLAKNYQYIPFEASVLDMGMGEGRNAVFLAQKGYKVTGIDISSVAVKKAHLLAQEFGVKFKGIVASLKEYKIAPQSYDAIICFYYVDRSLVEKMKSWLKPGGIIIFEAHTVRQNNNTDRRGVLDEFLLKEQELLKLFPGMRVLKYEEPLHEKEFRSSIILKKE